jgi:hypothetical protein
MITEQDARELQAALKTTEGREQIAQTMYEPFKKGRDYVAIFRQVFAVDHLPAGAPSWYDLDPQFTAAVVGAKGGVTMTEVEATRVNVDPQILAVMPKVHALDVAVRRFNILDREQERAQHEMAKLEDDNGFLAIRNSNLTGSDIVNAGDVNPAVTSTAGLDLGSLADGFALVSQYDIPVANVVLHALQTRDIRVWTHRQFDPVNKIAAICLDKGPGVLEHPAISGKHSLSQSRGKAVRQVLRKSPTSEVLAKRKASWLAKSHEDRQAIIDRRKASLKATWAAKPVRTNRTKGLTAEARYGAEKAAQFRDSLAIRMRAKNPMRNEETRKKMQTTKTGQPSPKRGCLCPYQMGDLNPARRPEVRAKISASKVGKLPPHAGFFARSGFRTDLGHFVRSAWEANVARMFVALGLRYEYERKSFPVEILGAVLRYTPDFYIPSKNLIVEVKGYMLPIAAEKIRAFRATYPHYRFVLIGERQYTALARQWSHRLPAFEVTRRIRRDCTLDTRKGDDTVRSAWRHAEAGRNARPFGGNSEVTTKNAARVAQDGVHR